METARKNPSSDLPSRLAWLERELGSATKTAFWRQLRRREAGAPLLGISPRELDLLFYLLLCQRLRAGGEASAVQAVLDAARSAAAAGAVGWRTPVALRAALDRLAAEIRAAGLWSLDRPLWWAPLPAPRLEEDLWHDLDGGQLALRWPSRHLLQQRFAPDDAPGWLSIAELVPAALVRQLHPELEEAFRQGRLTVHREGVGAAGKVSVRRSDQVLYTAGVEAELLAAVPHLAVLVQSCLAELERRLGDVLPDRLLSAPQNAMLARYPAPSSGYAAHLDNPGGAGDNGRALSLVVYLNRNEEMCAGGELDLWTRGVETSRPPAATLAPRPGSAALFDSRKVPHRVRELRPGPARWALTFWLNEHRGVEPHLPEPPRLSVTEAMIQVPDPLLPPDRVAFHELDDQQTSGQLRSCPAAVEAEVPRLGVVCTVYRGDAWLERWLEHHFVLGVAHAVLVFDHLDDPLERAGAERVRAAWPSERLSVWSGRELLDSGWSILPAAARTGDLLRFARQGSSSHAVASRQTLNASLALEQARRGELGARPLDWLLHLDIDEFFVLEGRGRGGQTLGEHLGAASADGADAIRYLNHELLAEEGDPEPRFKINPRLAAARLGRRGWQSLVEHLEMSQDDRRPYFNGYLNGKSAVRVAAAEAAAGVHGWSLKEAGERRSRFLAGPAILHFHFASAAAFRDKYLAIASSSGSPQERPFAPSPTEVAALALIAELEERGADETEIAAELEALHRTRNHFSPSEIELLEEAGLLWRPAVLTRGDGEDAAGVSRPPGRQI